MIRKIEHLQALCKGNTKRSALALRACKYSFQLAFIKLFVMVSFTSFVGSFPCVAFSGSRVGGSPAWASCRSFLPVLGGFRGSVAVGCARGVDSLVRSAFPSASVFRVSSFLVGGRVSRASFALRSSALVSWCASGSGLLVAFPLGACPSGVRVSSSFGGCGSGSWGSVALGVGLGCSVLVVLPSSVVGFPAPSSVASRFRCVGVAPCGGALWLSSPVPFPAPPVGSQLSLF
jgi:hypothetical protein